MISISPSEGLAPAQSGPKQNKLSDPSSRSDESSFSKMVSRDTADGEVPAKTDPQTADTAAGSGEPSSDPVQPKRTQPLIAREQIDPAVADAEQALAAASDSEVPRPATDAEIQLSVSDDPRAPQNVKTTDLQAQAPLQPDADTTTKKPRVAAAPAGSTSVDPVVTENMDSAREIKTAPTAPLVAKEAVDSNAKIAGGTPDVSKPQTATAETPVESDDVLRIMRNQDGADVPGPELRTAQLAADADLAGSINKTQLVTTNAADARAPTAMTSLPEALLSVAQPTSVSAPALTSGLAPIAPSIPLAAPNEISSIILNALRNGAEPQDQLIVQLDPPELGRVAIDFKFDAQGVQQITVTSENPEALKRLRELHFELTEALKDHGLSEQNLSFRQHADDRSQPDWQIPELTRSDLLFSATDEPKSQASPIRSNTAYALPERLDLTL